MIGIQIQLTWYFWKSANGIEYLRQFRRIV